LVSESTRRGGRQTSFVGPEKKKVEIKKKNISVRRIKRGVVRCGGGWVGGVKWRFHLRKRT